MDIEKEDVEHVGVRIEEYLPLQTALSGTHFVNPPNKMHFDVWLPLKWYPFLHFAKQLNPKNSMHGYRTDPYFGIGNAGQVLAEKRRD